MSASDAVSRYQFHHKYWDSFGVDEYNVYRGDEEVGNMDVTRDADEPATVRHLAVSKGHQAIFPTMLGIAQRHAEARGEKLSPSDNLSGFSSRVVRNLQGRGLVTGSAITQQSNAITFSDPKFVPPARREGVRLNTTEVNEGREHMRSALRNAPKRR